ncbi:DEAD/DEAH box helicase [Novosphingobium clariflavum]|uniref:DEAD/DEAH box helicase n=1 Tax=Novosphingobium clariflavum TaxID=2029884 RepID=A0ABV6S887_9SPHN|nr:DEAD/DEAH box helicase [Novosphingobium clariflavum]
MTNVVEVRYGSSGASQKIDALGMRPMQARAWKARAAQYLLVKAPPASGKSRALMFVALDKLHRQGIGKAIVAVPERSIGASFDSTSLSTHGFFTDWHVAERWNLCTSETGGARDKVDALRAFLDSDDRTLVCTHSTLRFAYERFGAEAFDGCLLAIDEFHHAAADQDNRLGELVRGLLDRNRVHIVAMTGSYFRGDQIAVMRPEDEDRFERVTYTYYEQLDGYSHLKTLGIGYHFYRGRYLDAIGEVLDSDKKTIIHIPNVNAAESVMEKYDEVNHIIKVLGEYESTDPDTGFLLVRRPDGRLLKVADLVDDSQARDTVVAALRKAKDRDAVDIIIALGMAKEGFDWIWCEHALTVGYRSSLTEVVQIIGRATRDAPDKAHAQFTNLIAEPLAEQGAVVTAVNDMLKAITASLLMEQVMAPRFRFHPRPEEPETDLGTGGSGTGMHVDEDTGIVHIAVKGLKEPSSDRVRMIVEEDLNDLLANVCQDPRIAARAVADDATAPEVVNQVLVPKVIEERYPYLAPEEVEEVREHLLAGMAVIAEVNRLELEGGSDNRVREGQIGYDADEPDAAQTGATRFIEMVRRFVNVADLSVDLIDSINPFQQAYEVLSKRMDAPTLARIHGAIAGQRISMTEDEALALWPRIQRFRAEEGRPPNAASTNELEKRLGAALEWLKAEKRRRQVDAVVQAAS